MPTLADNIFRRTFSALEKLNTKNESSSSEVSETSLTTNEKPLKRIKIFLETFSGKFNYPEERLVYVSSDKYFVRTTLQILRSDLKEGPVYWIDEMDSALASLLLTKGQETEKAETIKNSLSSLKERLGKIPCFRAAHVSDEVFRRNYNEDAKIFVEKCILSQQQIDDFNGAVADLIAEKQRSQIATSSSQSEEIQVQNENENVLVFNKAKEKINALMIDSKEDVRSILGSILKYLEEREVLFSRRVLLCQISGLSNNSYEQDYAGGRIDPMERKGSLYPYYLRSLDIYLADFLQAIQLLKTRSRIEAIEIIKLIRDFEIKDTVLNDLLSKRHYVMASWGKTPMLVQIAIPIISLGICLGIALLLTLFLTGIGGVFFASGVTFLCLGSIAAACLLVACTLVLSALLMEKEARLNHEKKFFSTEVKIDDLNTMVEELGETLTLSDSKEKPVTTVESASVDQMQTASSEQSIEIDRRYIPEFQRNDKELEERISKTRQLVIERLLNNKNTFFAQNAEKLQASCGDAPQIGVSAAA